MSLDARDGREVVLRDGMILVSRTDLGGKINFVNKHFFEISGYSQDELLGAPHNIVRHPDMPKEAFADLWRTIKAGAPWEGVVKNRTKQGGFYWVRANVTPLVEKGQVVGYTSIRTKPSRAEIEQATRVYQDREAIRHLNKGRVETPSLRGKLASLFQSIGVRINTAFVVLGMMMLTGTAAGLGSMKISNDAVESVYHNGAVRIGQLSDVDAMVRDQALLISVMAARLSNGMPIDQNLDLLRKNREALDSQFKRLLNDPDIDRQFLAAADAARTAFVRDVVDPAIQAGAQGDTAAVRKIAAEQTWSDLAPVRQSHADLVAGILKNADADYAFATKLFSILIMVMPAILLAAVLVTLLARRILGLSIRHPIARLEGYFSGISQGDLAMEIPNETTREFQHSVDMLRAMRAKLAYSTLETAELHARSEEILKSEMLALSEMLESEIEETVGDISRQAQRLTDAAVGLASVAGTLRTQAREVGGAIEITSANVQTVAEATQELESSSRAIAAQIGHSTQLADGARIKAETASQSMAGLTEATSRIGSVVTMIETISSQTRLLALNATIEAARAGDAGKGFVIVADEVKSLALKTEKGIGRVRTQADEIGSTTSEAVITVESVASVINEISEISQEVAKSADEQRAATGEIMESAAQAAGHTRTVAENVLGIVKGVEHTEETAARLNELSASVHRDVTTLQRRLYVILRNSPGGNRRKIARPIAAIKFSGTADGKSVSGFTGNITSEGALLILSPRIETRNGSPCSLDLAGIGTITAQIVAQDVAGLHVRFLSINQQHEQAIHDQIAKIAKTDSIRLEMLQAAAAKTSTALSNAIATGAISREDLFDVEYRPIPGTKPQQVIAKHTKIAEQLFPPIFEPIVENDRTIIFCSPTDRNGLIASHNKKYSLPQRPDDPVWNAANSRNGRVFNDHSSILAARCVKSIAQTYVRDMGGSKFNVVKEIAVPIMVDGHRWGAVRGTFVLG